jgi:deoxyribodipyrimidine photo-lyase
VQNLIDSIDPIKYAKTRNFLNGAVTRLSPYISRGVISTKQVYLAMLAKGYKLWQIEKFVQELAWRDYFQQVWRAKGDAIHNDLKQEQQDVMHKQMPTNVLNAATGISGIDDAINELYNTGYMHNHARMYTAAIVCNMGKAHWHTPAQWLYYHLLDCDWASNALSWQWVAGSFSSKKYVANQENINKYCNTNDKNTFLDIPYDGFEAMECPVELEPHEKLLLKTVLPATSTIRLDNSLPTYVYNSYNLDPKWEEGIVANRVLLLEPSHFEQYAVSNKVLQFVLDMGKLIPNIQVYVGEYSDFVNEFKLTNIHYKEHPTAKHYHGTEHIRDWLVPEVTGYFPSFFGYWKKIEKLLKKQ